MEVPFDLYIKKGTTVLPDPSAFDSMFKGEKRLIFNNFSFDTTAGFLIAVVVRHAQNETLNVSFADHHFIMFNAAVAKPAPPLYNLP
jgi:hypothetical protein